MKPSLSLKKVHLLAQQKVGEAHENPYLSLHRLTLQNTWSDGSQSAPYPYDAVLRKWLDAVVILLWCQLDGEYRICLRRSIRPPLLLRPQCQIPVPETAELDAIWELPAGLIEPTDIGVSGIARRAQLEIREETGYDVPAQAITPLKGASFISPGTIPERLWYVVARVEFPDKRDVPLGDGSPIEENAEIKWVELESALQLCEDGAIEDMKTELGIRRFASLIFRGFIATE